MLSERRTPKPREEPRTEEGPLGAGAAQLPRASGREDQRLGGKRGGDGAPSRGLRRRHRLPAGGHAKPREREARSPGARFPAADSNTGGWRARPISARRGWDARRAAATPLYLRRSASGGRGVLGAAAPETVGNLARRAGGGAGPLAG